MPEQQALFDAGERLPQVVEDAEDRALERLAIAEAEAAAATPARGNGWRTKRGKEPPRKLPPAAEPMPLWQEYQWRRFARLCRQCWSWHAKDERCEVCAAQDVKAEQKGGSEDGNEGQERGANGAAGDGPRTVAMRGL